MNESALTVIIPTLNAMAFLPRLVESLSRQTVMPQEVIVVDGESMDGTRQFVQDCRAGVPIRIIDQKPAGIYAAWNAGVAAARTKHCYVACADDIMYPDLIATFVRLRSVFPGADFYSWPVDVIDESDHVIQPGGSPVLGLVYGANAATAHLRSGRGDALTTAVLGSPYLSMMGVVFSVRAWRDVGGFSLEFGSAGDLAFQLTVLTRNDATVAYEPNVHAAWRDHSAGATAKLSVEAEWRVRRRLFERYVELTGADRSDPAVNALRQALEEALIISLMVKTARRRDFAELRALVGIAGSRAILAAGAQAVRGRLSGTGSLENAAMTVRRAITQMYLHGVPPVVLWPAFADEGVPASDDARSEGGCA